MYTKDDERRSVFLAALNVWLVFVPNPILSHAPFCSAQEYLLGISLPEAILVNSSVVALLGIVCG